ncbi:AMP-binding protein [Conservatibacter flavescens]|uniref:AMP-binding protein n=1 Tax=Conservatibacter flavescens TaxID=28161 RepID=A0A2M8S2S1_9PAST|nr:class I adenylate-forming enzyme family protein [Conservatibacter flavescens]PJG85407.1 AMP-binding protein [Conservatibacter flavescens]
MQNNFSFRTQQITQQLKQEQIQSVALWLESATDFACALLACLNAKVRVILPPNLLEENQQWVAENSGLLLNDDNFAEYGTLQKIEQIAPLFDQNNQTEIWLKTSGSSGSAKIIKKTACQMWLEAKALAETLPFERGEQVTVLGSVSVQHLYGLTFRIFLALEMGWTLGQKQLQYPEFLIAETRHSQKAIWISSPALLSHLNLTNPEFRNLALCGIISAGSALPENVAQAIRQTLPCAVVEIYGSTETGVVAYRSDNQHWQPLKNSQIGVNEQGALWVESTWISQREQTADVVNITEQGFELFGRIDRIVKLGDKRVSLAKIEQDLLHHEWVKDCFIGIHPVHSRPVAWLALNVDGLKILELQGRKAVIQALRQFLQHTQEKFALPRYWRFSETLPRNSQSKIERKDFERICLNNEN